MRMQFVYRLADGVTLRRSRASICESNKLCSLPKQIVRPGHMARSHMHVKWIWNACMSPQNCEHCMHASTCASVQVSGMNEQVGMNDTIRPPTCLLPTISATRTLHLDTCSLCLCSLQQAGKNQLMPWASFLRLSGGHCRLVHPACCSCQRASHVSGHWSVSLEHASCTAIRVVGNRLCQNCQHEWGRKRACQAALHGPGLHALLSSCWLRCKPGLGGMPLFGAVLRG